MAHKAFGGGGIARAPLAPEIGFGGSGELGSPVQLRKGRVTLQQKQKLLPWHLRGQQTAILSIKQNTLGRSWEGRHIR